ncbi:MAG: MmgE/PrpD family protein [Chloroflexi bacterium]|nr:MmgE/PrpD family protein [Chloroflexota bacterium]
MDDLSYLIARTASQVTYKSLPLDAVEATKKFTLDTLATIVAGSSAPGCKAVVGYVKECDSRRESTVLVFGGKVSAADAALANGVMAHAIEFDDTYDKAALHANVAVLPAALAAAERVGNASGKDLITSLALGVDLMCRVGAATSGPLLWSLSSAAGYFGASIAAGKLLGLTEAQLLDAMGIAYSQVAGNHQCAIDGALVKRMQPAFAARGGIFSCLLAQRGITGAKNVFEGKFGFFQSYQRGVYNRATVADGIGERFEGVNLSAKPYPSCRLTHAPIDGALDIVKRDNIRPEDVAEVTVHVNPWVNQIVGSPFEIREAPQVDAQLNIPYTIAVAICKRDVQLEDFIADNVRGNSQVLDLARRVKLVVDLEVIDKGIAPCIVDITTHDKHIHSLKVEIPRGDPRRPLSMEDVAKKFHKCAEFSARPLSRQRIERIVEAVDRLESVENVTQIVKLLA